MYISGTIILVVLAACVYQVLSKSSSRHSSELARKKRLIAEATMVKDRYKGISWDDMSTQDKDMYQCAVERLTYLQSLNKNHTHQDNLLAPWPNPPQT